MSAPVKNTCPKIDLAIKWVRGAINEAKEGLQIESEKSQPAFKEILEWLDGVEGIFEDLRDANAQLRDWGYRSEVIITDLEGQLDVQTEENRCLKEYIEKLEAQNSHLTEFLHQTI